MKGCNLSFNGEKMPETRLVKLSISERNGHYVASLRSNTQRNARRLELKPHSEDIRRINEELTESLADVVRRMLSRTGNQARLTGAARDLARSEFQWLAERGGVALDDIFYPEDLNSLRDMVGTASRVILDVDSDCFVFPWELLYDDYRHDGLEYGNFWGFKYIIYRNIPPRPGLDVPASEVELRSASVGLLADRSLPKIARQEVPFLRKLERAQLIKLFSPSERLEPTLRKTLLDTDLRHFFGQEMDIVHFACHTRAPVVEAREPRDEYCLLIAKDFPLWRSDFSTYKLCFGDHPLVILNACGTSPRHPLTTRNMVRKLLEHGARGVVTTECIVPDALAAAFTEEFYPRLLNGQELGDALFETRHALLCDSYNNPLGLLYALYAYPATKFIRTN